MIITGIRGHDVKAESLSNVAEKMQGEGLEYVQLVLEKSIPGFGYGQYTEEYAKEIKAMLGKTKIAVLGSYINPSNPDDEALRYDIERFKEKIKYASTLNPIVVGTETGRYKDGETHSEEAYQRVLKTVRELVSEAEKYGVSVGIEGVHLFVIDTPRTMKRLIDDVNSDNLKVIFDPMNYLNDDNYQNQDEMIRELFDLLHDKVVCVHVKDFKIVDGKMRSCPAGTGLLNFKLIFNKMREYGLTLPFISEDLSDEDAVLMFERLRGLL